MISIDNSVLFADAQESVNELHQIVLDVEEKVDLEPPQESMQHIELFENEEDIDKYLPLGLNRAYDSEINFSPRDLVLIGGRRGSRQVLTCANIANNVVSLAVQLSILPLKWTVVQYCNGVVLSLLVCHKIVYVQRTYL